MSAVKHSHSYKTCSGAVIFISLYEVKSFKNLDYRLEKQKFWRLLVKTENIIYGIDTINKKAHAVKIEHQIIIVNSK